MRAHSPEIKCRHFAREGFFRSFSHQGTKKISGLLFQSLLCYVFIWFIQYVCWGIEYVLDVFAIFCLSSLKFLITLPPSGASLSIHAN